VRHGRCEPEFTRSRRIGRLRTLFGRPQPGAWNSRGDQNWSGRDLIGTVLLLSSNKIIVSPNFPLCAAASINKG
jgi:hypothetical protein